MEAAIRDMRAPQGMKRCKVPKNTIKRSILYDHGVRCEEDGESPDPKKQKFFCMVSPNCRRESLRALATGGIHIGLTATGNATRHLRDVHNIVSKKTQTVQDTKASQILAAKELKPLTDCSSSSSNSNTGPNQGRDMALMYVKVFIIRHLLAFCLDDSGDVRAFFGACGSELFPTASLYPKMMKHYVSELYGATVSRFSYALVKAVKEAGGPVLHASFDLWTSKASDEKYVGLRLFWMSNKFVVDSALVSVKPFRPSAVLSDGNVLSNALLVWVEGVLAEYGVASRDLFCTVTDAGSLDVKRLCLKVASSTWEWSLPHLLNCALVEAFGTSAFKNASKNTAARAIIGKVKRLVEHLNECPNVKVRFDDVQGNMCGRSAKLVNAVPRHWISSCNALEEVLRNWPSLQKHYTANESVAFPLAPVKTSVEELYSLMRPVACVIESSQKTSLPTALSSFLDLVAVRTSVLKEGKPLTVYPARKLEVASDGAQGEAATPAPVQRAAADLERVTVQTRRLLAEAVDKRFFDKRYNERVKENPGPAYVFEMAASMNPFCSKLLFLPVLCSSEAKAERVKGLVRGKVVDLMTRLAEGAAAGEGGTGSHSDDEEANTAGDSPAPSPWKERWQARSPAASLGDFGTSKGKAEAARLMASGMFGENPSGASKRKFVTGTKREACQKELDGFLERHQEAEFADFPASSTIAYWQTEGKKLFPNMARAARVLLSVPASSAVIERDFSSAGRLETGCRSRADAAYAEMVLFLNGSQECIPAEVPELSREQVCQVVPHRLSSPKAEVTALSSVGETAEGDCFDRGKDEYELEQFCAHGEHVDSDVAGTET